MGLGWDFYIFIKKSHFYIIFEYSEYISSREWYDSTIPVQSVPGSTTSNWYTSIHRTTGIYFELVYLV
jgi:hypothetical protein